MLVIKKYVRIREGECILNGQCVFRAESLPVRDWLTALYRERQLEYPKFFKMDILAKAGFLAAELLMQGEKGADNRRTGLFFANACSSLDTDRHYQETIGESYFPSPSVFVYTLPNIVLGEICIRHRIFGENTFFVSKEFPVTALRQYTQQVFADSGLERALLGWLECEREVCQVLALLVEEQMEGMEFTDEHINALNNKDYGRIDGKIEK